MVFPGLGFLLALLVFKFLDLAAEGEPSLVDASAGSGVELPEVHDLAFAVGDAFVDFREVLRLDIFAFSELPGEEVDSEPVLTELVAEEGVRIGGMGGKGGWQFAFLAGECFEEAGWSERSLVQSSPFDGLDCVDRTARDLVMVVVLVVHRGITSDLRGLPSR